MVSEVLFKNILNNIKNFLMNMKNLNCIPNNQLKLIDKLNKIEDTDSHDNTSKKLEEIFKQITLWQHPNFYAFFPSTITNPAILGALIDTIHGNYTISDSNLNDLELESCEKYRQFFKLPEKFSFEKGGVSFLNSTCGYSSLHAILLARIMKKGVSKDKLVIYITDMCHNHIEKSVVLSEVQHIRKIKSILDENRNIVSDFDNLEKQIIEDKKNGLVPFFLFGVFGSTNLGFIIDIKKFNNIKKKYDMLFFMDSAYGGAYMGWDSIQKYKEDIENVDIISINLSKSFGLGMGNNLIFINDRHRIYNNYNINTESNDLSIYKPNPTFHSGIIKSYILMNCYKFEEFSEFFKFHYKIKDAIKNKILKTKELEIFYECNLPLVTLRYVENSLDLNSNNILNEKIMNHINNEGKYYLVCSESFGYLYLRISIGNIIDYNEENFEIFLDYLVNIGNKLKIN